MSRLLFLLLLGALSACCDPDSGCEITEPPPEPPAAPTVRVWAGDDQSAEQGRQLADPIAVQVANAPVGMVATFSVTSGGGRVGRAGAFGTSAAAPVDPSGVAEVAWELGTALGAQRVRITFSGIPNFLEMMATAHGPAALLRAVRGSGQTGAPGGELAVRPAVALSDADGRPIPGARIEFAGDLPGTITATSRDGVAELPFRWTLGTVARRYQAVATYLVGGSAPAIIGNPVIFSADAVPSAAVGLAKVAGDLQAAPVGAALPVAPSVRLTDEFGNGVPGIAVTFSREQAGGGLTDSVRTTDASGLATIGAWTLGGEGTHRVTAMATGTGIAGNPATFTATAVVPAGPPARVVIVSGDKQTGEVTTALPERLRVRVLDAADRPVPNVQVDFSAGTGSGSVALPFGSPPIRSDASGEATSPTWTLGQFAGPQYVLVSLFLSPPGVVLPTFSATATPGRLQRLVRLGGDGGTYPTGGSVPIQQLPLVQILDQFNNPISGVSVTFAITSGGGTLASPTTLVTGPTGTVRAAGWTIGAAPGPNVVTATAVPLSGVSLVPATATFTKVGVLDVRSAP